MRILTFAGEKARYVLAVGCFLAVLVPSISAFLRPFLPYLVSLVLALAMARIDMAAMARAALRPGRLLLLLAISVILIPGTALVYSLISQIAGLDASERMALVLLAAAPPIASAAGLCFLLGFNARLAVEITISSALLTPILGPATVALLLPGLIELSPITLAVRLTGMIVLGVIAALAIRQLAGSDRITRNARAFDGITALVMLLFVIPLFDKVPALVLAQPLMALRILILAIIFNLGVNLLLRSLLAPKTGLATAGAIGILHGNRVIALYLAALPFDPTLAMFVALYQFPMYLTPLVLDRRRTTT